MDYLKTYFSQFSKSHLVKLILWLIIIVFAIDIIKKWIIDEIFVSVSKAIGYSNIKSTVIIIFFLVSFFYFIKKTFFKKQIISINYIIKGLFFLIFYYLVFRQDNSYNFYKIFDNNIYWADLIIIGCVFLFSDYIYIKKSIVKNANISLVEDFDLSNVDLLSRSDYAKQIVATIKATVTNKSFATAIVGEWGSGKTVFLNKIEQYLKEEPNDNIIINFNPWKTEGTQKILQLFFSTLESKLSEFDTKIATKIKDYADKLLDIDDSAIAKITKFTLGEVISVSDSLEDKSESINSSIERIGKRIIIVVDDIDRLTGPELISVMRLIINSANFKNVFFLAAFDYNYVVNILGENKYITNKEKYLDKIFQLQIILPPIRGNDLRKAIRYHLGVPLPLNNPNSEQVALDKAIVDLSYNEDDLVATLYKGVSDNALIERLLENIRDVKRFSNGFKIVLRTIGDEVYVRDLMLLELIKFKYPSIFKLLFNKTIIKYDSNKKQWIVDEKELKELTDNKQHLSEINIHNDKTTLLKEALLELFKSNDISRSIIRPTNYHLYFNYQLFDSVSLKDFNSAQNQGFTSLNLFIDKVKNENRISGLIEMIEGIVAFNNATRYENILKSLIYISNQEKFVSNISYIIASYFKNEENIIKSYYNNDKTVYKNSLNNILLDMSLPHIIRSSMATERLRNIMYGKGDNIFQADELKNIIFLIYEDFINNYPKEESKIYDLYYDNIESIDSQTNKVILSSQASQIFRNYLDDYPTFFIKHVIRSQRMPNMDDEYVFAPFINQIFENDSNFVDFIKQQPLSSCTSFILDKFNEYIKNNKQPIIIENFEKTNPCRDY